MIKVPMLVWRIISYAYLSLILAYALDKYAVIRIFNFSDHVHWKFLLLPSLVVLITMPSQEELRDYVSKKPKDAPEKMDDTGCDK